MISGEISPAIHPQYMHYIPNFVSSCIKKLDQNSQKTMFESQISLLKGLELVTKEVLMKVIAGKKVPERQRVMSDLKL